MNDLPDLVREELNTSIYERKDSSIIISAIKNLGVSPSRFFINFFENYTGPFWSEKLGYELLDLVEANPNIIKQTRICRELYKFPAKYIVLTELTAGQVAVLNSTTDEVLEVDFEGGDELLRRGDLKPRWFSFREFLIDYF